MSELGIQIAAAGESSRLRDYISGLGYPEGFPKFLLPTGGPNGETLLGKVLRQAIDAPIAHEIILHTSPENNSFIRAESDVSDDIDDHDVRTVFDLPGNSFRPFLPKLVESETTVLGSSADFYANFAWNDVINDHYTRKYPITFVVGEMIEVDKGAVFNVADDGKITDFARVDRTNSGDLVNVGIYIFEPDKAVLRTLEGLVSERQLAKEEEIVTKLVAAGLMGAHVLETMPYNVNSEETYQALLAHTSSKVTV